MSIKDSLLLSVVSIFLLFWSAIQFIPKEVSPYVLIFLLGLIFVVRMNRVDEVIPEWEASIVLPYWSLLFLYSVLCLFLIDETWKYTFSSVIYEFLGIKSTEGVVTLQLIPAVWSFLNLLSSVNSVKEEKEEDDGDCREKQQD